MNTSKKYKCKRYNPNTNDNCWPPVCPITRYNFKGFYKSTPCKEGVVELDWILYITKKEVINEYFTEI